MKMPFTNEPKIANGLRPIKIVLMTLQIITAASTERTRIPAAFQNGIDARFVI